MVRSVAGTALDGSPGVRGARHRTAGALRRAAPRRDRRVVVARLGVRARMTRIGGAATPGRALFQPRRRVRRERSGVGGSRAASVIGHRGRVGASRPSGGRAGTAIVGTGAAGGSAADRRGTGWILPSSGVPVASGAPGVTSTSEARANPAGSGASVTSAPAAGGVPAVSSAPMRRRPAAGRRPVGSRGRRVRGSSGVSGVLARTGDRVVRGVSAASGDPRTAGGVIAGGPGRGARDRRQGADRAPSAGYGPSVRRGRGSGG